MSSDESNEDTYLHPPTVDEALRQELLRMMDADQEMRRTMMRKYAPGSPVSEEDASWSRSIDTAHTERLKQIIAEYGWPGRSLVAHDGTFAAWLLVQHADHDREFQRQCLQLLQAAAATGESRPTELAYLTDRVRVGEGQPQVYGTQMTTVDGNLTPQPIEDEAHVDERRAKIGLEPLADYIATVKAHYQPATSDRGQGSGAGDQE